MGASPSFTQAVDPWAISQHHDPAMFAEWRKDMQEKQAQGEDPWKDYERRAKEQRSNTLLGKWEKGLKNMGRKIGGKGSKDQHGKVEDLDGRGYAAGSGREKDDGVIR